MRMEKRRWFWLLIVLLGGAIAVLCGRLWPHERLLLERATREQSNDPEMPTEEWPDDWRQAPVIVFHDRITGKKRRVRFSRPCEGTHTQLIYSSDGQWALSWDGGGGPGGHVFAMELQTGRTLSWPNLGHTYHLRNLWLADGKRWLQYPTIDDGYLTIYSTEKPKLAIRLTFPDPVIADWRHANHCLTSQDHLLFYEQDNQPEPAWTHVDVREYRLLPAVRLLHIWHLHTLAGQEYEDMDFSHAGDRVAWLCSESYVSPLSVWLHRWLSRFAVESQPRLGLWVSKIDGTDAHEVGHIPEASRDPEGDSVVTDLCWLPSGKRLSFVYKGNLYTVPTE